MRQTIEEERYHLGWSFERVEQAGAGVLAYFSGGRSQRADLLIGADGIRSSVRSQVAPEAQPIYSGYYIWRGAPNEADLSLHTRETIFPYFTFYLPERQQVIGYPIAGLDNDLRPGHRRYNFIWYRVGDAQTLRAMCIDKTGQQHEYSVPPPLIRDDLIAQMRADLRFLDAATGLWTRCARGRCRFIGAPAHGFRHGEGRRGRAGARRGSCPP
jgi:2-polyprenyl-6-methoxyphenol hydroxylase-like FAD-dependent oxidoreductase